MEKHIVTTGKTIDLAIEAALTQLGLDRDSVSVQVLSQAKPGFLGFGATPARVQVSYEAPDPVPEAPKSALTSASRSKPKKKVETPKQEAPKVQQQSDAIRAEATAAPVTEEALAKVIELWTGVPASKVQESELGRLSKLEDALRARVIGQEDAVQAVAAAIRRRRAGISEKRKPISFILFILSPQYHISFQLVCSHPIPKSLAIIALILSSRQPV